MAKTLISRLDAENIVRAAVDPETHEATGDVYDSVNDVSYPFGGGGSSSEIPVCTVKIDNQLDNALAFGMVLPSGIFNWLDDNNILLVEELPLENIPVGETTLRCLPMGTVDADDEPIIVNTWVKVSTNVTLSDLVNCSSSIVDSDYQVVPTDTTQNSSFTITLSSAGD